MNDSLPVPYEFVPAYVATRTVVQTMGLAVVSAHAFKTQFMGHTDYQIQRFIINDKDFPTNDTKYRQICRELWARTEAAIQNRFNWEKAAGEIVLIEEERKGLRWKVWRSKAWKAAKDGLLSLEVQNRKAVRAQLQLDFEQRILRESERLLKMLSELSPPADDQDAQEKEAWTMRAQTEPRLKELVK